MSCIMRFQTGDRSWALPLMHQRCALLNSGVRRASKATPMLDQRSNVPLSTAIFLSLKFSVALVMNHQQWSFYPLVLLSPGRTQRTSPTTSDSAVSPSSCTDGTGPRIGVGMSCSGATRYSGMNLTNVVGSSPYLKIEYMVASFDDEARSARLSLRQQETLAKLEATAHGASFCSPDK